MNLRQKIKLKKFKSEVEIEEIKMDELSMMVKVGITKLKVIKLEIENWKMKCEGEIWKLKKLWVKKAEIDKSGNKEIWM